MADLIYMKLTGTKQGLISASCGSIASIGTKYQVKHPDEILVYSVQHLLTRKQNINHHAVSITKPIDKSSPLLAKAIDSDEELSCEISFYRTSTSGGVEKYYSIVLEKAKLDSLHCDYPHSVDNNQSQPQEIIDISYGNIIWRHLIGATETYSLWIDRVY
ncbi:Hcp family type VI secretion system effector [Erwinia tracheiphila]|uniref:Hcp family type VI secretion system effector n=1 Tax=Erwinia tracheiphila TaxID=65700 RepID=A0A345CNJ5_9GAMM|nr:Hcp family type VI secretion system effector [Erwinia tracheiphila]AXF75012.1 Hcp family type VI secretion system effector [Erwinia tracheiphila]UIA82449.1 Hcp family type VI secretion system effector [Erwinia tracheiphila]UIA91038.1 Hcp family type VI secretion system effector [Erwinia tracheiphila]